MQTSIKTARRVSGEVRPLNESLAERLAERDPEAPGEMVETYYPELYAYARAMLRDATLAEDAVHDAFVGALEALGKYPAERIRGLALRAWLYRITLNKIRDHFRRASRKRESPFDEELHPESQRDPDGVMDVLDALAKLPEKQRIAVTLRYRQDLRYAEISAATGWPENTAKTLVRRGLASLRKALAVTENLPKPAPKEETR